MFFQLPSGSSVWISSIAYNGLGKHALLTCKIDPSLSLSRGKLLGECTQQARIRMTTGENDPVVVLGTVRMDDLESIGLEW